MEGFIIFSNTCGGNTAIRKSEIAVIHEGDDEEVYNCCNTLEEVLAKLEE